MRLFRAFHIICVLVRLALKLTENKRPWMSHLVKMASKEDSKKKKRHKKGDDDVPTLDAEEDQTPSSPRSEEKKKKKKTKKSKDGKSHSKKHHKSPRAAAGETRESSKRKLGDEDEDDSNDSGTVGIREDLMDIGKRKLAARPVESGKSSKRGDEVYTVSFLRFHLIAAG